MSKLVLIDSMAILHRAYHALPPFTTKKGEPIGAVYGLLSMFLKIIQDLKPTHIALCFDQKEKTFRQEMFADYQIQRPEVINELSSQFVKARELAEVVGLPSYSKAGYEADDVIGTIASQVVGSQKSEVRGPKSDIRNPISEVTIVTGDRDILQLVDDKKNIKLYMPITGLSNAKLFGEQETLERMGVSPKLIPDFKGLVGDASDNYKGIAGVGPKTAINLLNEFGGFESIYKNLDKIPDKVRSKLEAGRESGEMSYKLAKIVKDVPVDFDLDDMNKWKIDSDKVLDTLQNEYGFKTLTKRVKEVGKEISSENQGSLF